MKWALIVSTFLIITILLAEAGFTTSGDSLSNELQNATSMGDIVRIIFTDYFGSWKNVLVSTGMPNILIMLFAAPFTIYALYEAAKFFRGVK